MLLRRQDGVLSLREVLLPLALLQRLPAALRGRERAPQRARLLGPQVLGQELLPGVGLAKLCLLCLVVHRQHARDGLAHDADLGELRRRAARHLGDASCASSFFSSSSVFSSSLLFLVRSSCALIFIAASRMALAAGGGFNQPHTKGQGRATQNER